MTDWKRMSNANVPLAKGWQIMNFDTTRTITASIQHWQLRHLLKPSQGLCEAKDQEHSVIYVHEKKLFTVTIKHGSTLLPREVASLDFAPFCLAFAHGFIAVGGDGGLVSILQVIPHTLSVFHFCFYFFLFCYFFLFFYYFFDFWDKINKI